MTVVVEDLQGYPTFDCTLTSQKLVRQCRVAWDDIEALSIELFSNVIVRNGTPTYAGKLHPQFRFLRASAMSVTPIPDDPALMDAYGCARYAGGAFATITYERPDYENPQVQDQPFYTQKTSIGGEFLSIPNQGLTWETGGKTPTGDGVQAGMFIPLIETEYTFPNVSIFPINTIRAYVGCVNNATWNGAVAETILFLGAEIDTTFNANGGISYSLKYRFSERRIDDGGTIRGWNHFMDPDNNNRWDRLKRGSNLIYSKKDLSQLFSQLS